jgi:excisionase family DNA binding protein
LIISEKHFLFCGADVGQRLRPRSSRLNAAFSSYLPRGIREANQAGADDMNDDFTESGALTVSEAADCLQVPLQDLYNLIAAGDGPPLVRLGLRAIIEREALLQWLKSRAQVAC